MTKPTLFDDGWELESGEARHADAPKTFWIPELAARKSLAIGDLAKLIFAISVDNADEPVAVERMWVIVRAIENGTYYGLLDNEPDSIQQNDEFWVGTEIPFGPEHVIDIEPGDEKSIALALTQPLKEWPRT
ncbi:DUF2314 domain-containing protein [Sphingomonas hylomeconis]|uniref:DUF2314 domain-containing protein n=1 Tax=Sphingomonas hylomeconis TaxID=1395958 RepID=A0ABV7SVC6_9SPHN|nr:DUF2314 domain-containing protein [Sphingomonas hylomeconis]